jgi:hypothetical protein
MIWLRRILAIPLIIIFVVVFVLGLVLCHLSGTVGSAGFYNGQMRKAHVYTWLYDNLTPVVLDETEADAGGSSGSPFDTPEIRKEIVDVAEQTFPEEWLQGTFENATRQIFPYVEGDKNSLTITIDVESRIDPMARGIKSVVDNHTTEIYNYATDELIVPAVTESLGTSTTLPYGITLSDDNITFAVKQAMPQDWTITQFKNMVDAIAAYLKGDSATLDLTVDLTSVKSSAGTALSTLADTKLKTAFDSITTTCTEAQFLAQLNSLPQNTMPSCKPAGYNYSQFKSALETKMGMTFTQAVNQNVTNQIPGSYHFDDAQMREALGKDLAGALDSARKFIVDDHGQITDQTLRKSDNGSTSTGQDNFDKVRSAIHTVKMCIWALWLIAILLLVGIGFLCGRNWKSRLLWPLCVLFVTCLIFVIVIAVASSVVPDRVVPASERDATQVATLMADKGNEMAHNAINTFVGGLEVKLVLFIVFSGLAIAGVIAWMIVDRRRHQRLTQNDPQSPPA